MKSAHHNIDRIQDIEIFVRIVERGSLTAAAVSLDLAKPLVSQRLASLERSLGVRLVDRSSRLSVLTEHGREFFGRAQSILKLVRESEMALRTQSAEFSGTLRICVPSTSVSTGNIARFVDLFRQHTNLCIEMRVSDRPVDVIGRGFDVAIYLTDAPDRHPGDIILAQHPTSLAAAPEYLNRMGRPTCPDDLLCHRTVRAVSSRGRPADWSLTGVDGQTVVVPPAGAMFLSDEDRVIYSALRCGAGIGRLPLGYIAKAAKIGELEVVLPQWRFRPIVIAATLRRQGPRSKKVAALLEAAMAVVKQIDEFAFSSPLEQYYHDQVALNAR